MNHHHSMKYENGVYFDKVFFMFPWIDKNKIWKFDNVIIICRNSMTAKWSTSKQGSNVAKLKVDLEAKKYLGTIKENQEKVW